MHIKKFFRLFLALPVILIFLTGCEPSTERIPKEEKAKLEAREKRAAEAEAAAAALLLKLEKEEVEAKRKAEERAKYIAENTKTTYLYCPFVPRGRAISSNAIMLFKLNKIDDEYLPSVARTILNSPASSDYQDCDWAGAIREPCETIKMDNGSMVQTLWTGSASLEKPYSKIYEYKKNSTSYGHKILTFGSSYRGYILDRVNLHATTQENELGDDYYGYYQCEVSSKEVYDKKIQEATDRLNVAVEAEKTKSKEKQSEETQI